MRDNRLRRWIAITLLLWTLICFISGLAVGKGVAERMAWQIEGVEE